MQDSSATAHWIGGNSKIIGLIGLGSEKKLASPEQLAKAFRVSFSFCSSIFKQHKVIHGLGKHLSGKLALEILRAPWSSNSLFLTHDQHSITF